MARRGQFGRAPRAVTSLTNTLVSIARSQEAQRDQNIVDAWKNGGEFEGQAVTDAMIMAHFNKRLDEVSKDDPQYDAYKDAVMQFDYTINESKQSLLYAQKKISAGQFASFYLKWAKKVPKDSEFYRIIQRNAANLIRSTQKAKVDNTAKIEEQKYQNGLSSITSKYIAGGQLLLEAMTYGARGTGDTNAVGSTAVLGGREQLTDANVSDPATILGMIERWKTAGDGVIYTDPSGHGVTGNEFLSKMKGIDPSFTWDKMNTNYIHTAFDNARTGTTKIIALATETGHASDANSARNSEVDWGLNGVAIGACPITTVYLDAKKVRDDVVDNPLASPEEKIWADQRWKAALGGLLKTPNLDNITKSHLMGEINGDENVTTIGEDFLGQSASQIGGATTDSKGENSKYFAKIEPSLAAAAAVETGAYVWAQGTYENGVFVAGAGNQIGATDRAQVQQEAKAGGYATTLVVSADGKNMTQVYVPMTPVFATATMPDGFTADIGSDPIGWVAQVNDNGTIKTEYGLRRADGTMEWSMNTFLKEGVTMQQGTGKMAGKAVVDITKYVPVDETGVPVGAEYGVNGSNMVVKIDGAKLAFDDSLEVNGGWNSDEASPDFTAARVNSSHDPAYRASYENNPAYFQQVVDSIKQSHGAVWEDGEGFHGWVGGDLAGIAKDLNMAGIDQGMANGLRGAGVSVDEMRSYPGRVGVFKNDGTPLSAQLAQTAPTVTPNDLVGYAYKMQAYSTQKAIADMSKSDLNNKFIPKQVLEAGKVERGQVPATPRWGMPLVLPRFDAPSATGPQTITTPGAPITATVQTGGVVQSSQVQSSPVAGTPQGSSSAGNNRWGKVL